MSTPLPSPAPAGDPVQRPANKAARTMLMIVAILLPLSLLAWWFTKDRNASPQTGNEPVQFAEPSEAEQVQARLEEMMGQIAAQAFGKAMGELTPENVTQVEQLAKPYPGATLDMPASSYEETDTEGQVYRLTYTTSDSPTQVKDWYESEWAEGYRTTKPNQPGGLEGFTIAIQVPGVQIAHEIVIVSVPDLLTGTSATQIWVTIRKTLLAAPVTP